VRAGERQNLQGLATVLTSDDMLGWLRSLYDLVRDRVLEAKPGATRLLEKTPDHAMTLDLVRRIVPDADIVFLVRDPRETVRSLLQASEEPWGHWAPGTVEGATERWLRCVRGPLERVDDERVLMVRYEDLRADDAALQRLAKFLRLGDPADWRKTAADAAPGERNSTIVAGEAAALGLTTYALPGFSFHDRANERQLTHFERAYVEARCGREMRALGYDTPTVRPPVAFRLRRIARITDARARNVWRRYRKSRSSRAWS
jgi:hypothetical protein